MSERNTPAQPIRFISDAVIERLRTGQFVPKRTAANVLEVDANTERRKTLSPLAICKRCIGYQALVFKDRLPLVWQLVEGLNSPYTKLLLVTGEPGSGKTSLLRSVAELMGGGKEQLVWFEISAYSSAISISETLLRQLVAIMEASNPSPLVFFPVETNPTHTDMETTTKDGVKDRRKKDPIQLQSSYDREKTFQRLQSLFTRAAHQPILLVLDDIDPFVSTQERLEAPALKETFNFLLNQPNIKIAIASKRQPYADLKAPPQSILELHLTRFDDPTIQQILTRTTPKLAGNTTYEQLFETLLLASQGQPWLVQLLCQVVKQSPEALPLLELTYQQGLKAGRQYATSFEEAVQTAPFVVEALANWLLQLPKTQEERLLLMVLSFMRHPVDEQVLKFLLPHSLSAFLQWAKHPYFKPFLRKQAEPQTLFNFLTEQLNQSEETPPVAEPTVPAKPLSTTLQFTILFELFPAIRQGILKKLSLQDRLSWHQQLDTFYTQQSQLFPQQRIFANSDTLTLSREARYHRDRALELSQKQQNGQTDGNNTLIQGYTTPIFTVPTPVSANTTIPTGNTATVPATTETNSTTTPKTNRDPQNDEAPLLTAITQAKQHQQATPYFKQLLLLATHRLKKLRLATAQKTIETILTNITTANTWQHPLQGLEYTTILAEAYTVQAQLAIVQEHPTLAIKHYQQALTHWESMADTAPEVATMPLVQCHVELMNLLAAQQQETVALNHAASILKRCPIQPNALITGNTNTLETDITPSTENSEQTKQLVTYQAESLVFQAKHRWQFQQGKALEAYKQAYHLFLSVAIFNKASEQLACMGKLFWDKGDLTKARHCFNRALQLDASHQEWAVTCQNQLDFALLAWEEGFPQEALSTLEQLLIITQKQKLPLFQVKTLLAMADIVAEKPGTLLQQKTYLQQAISLGRGVLSPKGLQTITVRLTNLTAEGGNTTTVIPAATGAVLINTLKPKA
jgi:tetratricopeptide (TPR) repeat protein